MKEAIFPKLTITFLALGVVGLGQAPRDRGFAAIVDSGSTNTNGFRIVVEPLGRTQSMIVPRGPQSHAGEPPAATTGTIPDMLARRLYSDLDAAWPLSSLPPQHCFKSASFGTRLTIEFAGQTTPDLSCSRITNPSVRALAKDAREIIEAAGVKRTGRE
jgi:hypothetical protein